MRSPQFRANIRKSIYFRHILALKRARQEGFSRAISRYRQWLRILDTAPVHTEPPTESSALELHILCYWRDYLCAMWALKSFYHYSAARYPLFIHLQGFVTQTMLRRVREHFPSAYVITQEEADPKVETLLADQGLYRLLDRRAQNPFILRLCDFSAFGSSPYLMMLDSDILFFDHPAELLAPPSAYPSFVFMRDANSGYAISPEIARIRLGIDLIPRVNVGIGVIKRQDLDLQRCDEFLSCAELAHGDPTLLDQTIYALRASEARQLFQLPSSYLLSMKAGLSFEGIVARHYAGDSRRLLTTEGMPQLIRRGFLKCVYSSYS